MNKAKIKITIWSFIISFTYVGIGTVSLLSVYPSSPLYGDWVLPAMVITLPVSIWGFGLMYADSHTFWSVIIVESIVCLISWRILFKLMSKGLK
jgi:hypothetical protein